MMRTGIFLNYAGGFRRPSTRSSSWRRSASTSRWSPRPTRTTRSANWAIWRPRRHRIELGSGVVPIYIRTPSLLAMTAAGLDYVSDGRFRLGIGTSGPQVMEGFHGVPFDAPLGRTREVVDICRQVWRRERVHIRREVLPDPAARRPGHRPRQAATADQSSCPRTHSDHDRGTGSEERRTHRRDRRGLAAGVLLPGEGRRGVG